MDAYLKIKNSYDLLSSSDQKIATYILKETNSFIHDNIYVLSKDMGVSTASISRFAKKIGYQSLAELKNDLLTELAVRNIQNPGCVKDVLHWDMELESILPLTTATIQEICEETLRINKIDQIHTLIEKIKNADVVYLCGYGGSSIPAREFQHKLLRLKKRCIYIEDANFNLQNLTSATPNDVLICISFSGQTNKVLVAAKRAMDMGVFTASITRFGDNQLAATSDLNLYVSKIANAEADVSSIFRKYGQHLLVDILYIGLAKSLSKNPKVELDDYIHQNYINK